MSFPSRHMTLHYTKAHSVTAFAYIMGLDLPHFPKNAYVENRTLLIMLSAVSMEVYPFLDTTTYVTP